MFNVGDRVIGVNAYQGNSRMIGVKGTIIYSEGVAITVEYDENIKGNSGIICNGKHGHCWNYITSDTKVYIALANNKIVELI